MLLIFQVKWSSLSFVCFSSLEARVCLSREGTTVDGGPVGVLTFSRRWLGQQNERRHEQQQLKINCERRLK